MKQFKRVDNLLGWLSFLIAAFVYCSTIEPTASFWDCPEFITTGYKLEVGHPPGAPFFAITANIFSQFASDPSHVAYMVNTMSALLSAVTIMFLFWTVTHLTRRLLIKDWSELTLAKTIAIEASGLVGALIYTFSDTFWFSAVEGEVYAYSSAFTAVVFWLILKWEDHADEPHSDRWLVLIMYMTGLSIGVHLLNLLCVPAIVLVYYYRRFPHKSSEADLRGSIAALAVSVGILVAVLYGVVPGIVQVGGWFELFFVNTLGCPFNTGVIIYIILLISCIIWAIYETYHDHNRKRTNIAFLCSVAMLGIPFYGHGIQAVVIGAVVLAALWFVLNYKKSPITARIKNTSLLCMLMLMIGYSSYALIVIRSSANPPMDQNSPEDIFTLGEYLGREQYGNRPLFYGQAYTSQIALDKDGEYCRPQMTKGAPIYQRKEKSSENEKDSYFVVRTRDEYKYAQNMLFPRMYSQDHAGAYESWMGGVSGSQVPYDRCGEPMTVKMPSQIENLRFFLSYQCNFMYWRYFMWNFAGRQNDIQGNGEQEHGNWITGFSWFDNWRLGDQDLLPDELKDNKGHNVFYCLPLLLGLIGLFWQSLRRGAEGIRQFWVVFFLFFMTGLAIVIYLNQTPMQPRERDYAYAGSFYAFAIWCGLGVAAITDEISRRLKANKTAIAAITGIVCLLVPVQMASQTWDDHDRSGRYTCRDFGQNYLMSLQQEGNPIVFTNGDNDTFPLWYTQDVEGVRTDARVCNLSYLQTDWYIDQMRRPAYDSPSLPITWSRLEYCAGTNEYIQLNPRLKDSIKELYANYPDEAKKLFGDNPFELKNILKYWVRNEVDEAQREVMTMLTGGEHGSIHILPTDTVYVTIDKEAVRKSGMMMASDSIPDVMTISLKGKNALYKGDLMMLEIIANSNWTRPVYVALTVGPANYMNLGDNFIQEGLVNRISPFTTNQPGTKSFDTKRTYDNIMKRFKFGGINRKGIYLDETVMRMCQTHRKVIVQLAVNLMAEGENKKAAEVLKYLEMQIPEYNVPADYYYGSLDQARVYSLLGDKTKAKRLYDTLWKKSEQYLNWYMSLDAMRLAAAQRECMMHLNVLQQVAVFSNDTDQAWSEKKQKEFEDIVNRYHNRGGRIDFGS